MGLGGRGMRRISCGRRDGGDPRDRVPMCTLVQFQRNDDVGMMLLLTVVIEHEQYGLVDEFRLISERRGESEAKLASAGRCGVAASDS